MSNEVNPYAAPETYNEAVSFDDSSAEQIRRAHINHEASVQSIGTLYLLVGIMCLLGVVFAFSDSQFAGTEAVGAAAAAFGLAALFFALCYGMNKLQSWTRILGVIFSVLGLLSFPVGTIIHAYILWLLLSKKGGVVYSKEYKQVMAATPHIKYKTSIAVWILLGILVALFVIGMIGFAVRSSSSSQPRPARTGS